MNSSNKTLDFNEVKLKKYKKNDQPLSPFKIKKVISNKLAEYLISRIVSGKIKNKKLSNAKKN